MSFRPPDRDHRLREHSRHQGGQQQRETLRELRGGFRRAEPQEGRQRHLHLRLLRPFRGHRHRQGRQVPHHQSHGQSLLLERPALRRVFNRGDSRTIYNVIYREGKSTSPTPKGSRSPASPGTRTTTSPPARKGPRSSGSPSTTTARPNLYEYTCVRVRS